MLPAAPIGKAPPGRNEKVYHGHLWYSCASFCCTAQDLGPHRRKDNGIAAILPCTEARLSAGSGKDGDAKPASVWQPAGAPRRPFLIASDPVPRRGEEVRKVGGFAVGDRVFHQKFGYGSITDVEDNKLAIHFDVAGDKKVMDAYVERA